MTSVRRTELQKAAAMGAAAGLAGVAVMTAAEKAEQTLTHRPNSYIPARTLITLVGGRPNKDMKSTPWNHVMHWGTGALLGSLRGIWSVTGIRGFRASATHVVVRLAFDQTLENATGAGASPDTWPGDEKVVDVAHKAIYSLVTGVVADRLISPVLESNRGSTSH
jgi:hypothetical protein